MAAKQGLTAQVYQASEDARRAVLSRAPTSVRSHSWLSNLNTTCTIKSAPPRTPEVMSMLSTKCGWLIKRNEQNVWQRRWCCVVPHSFLYYFDAEPIEAAAAAAAAAGNEYPLSPIAEGGDLNNSLAENGYKSPGSAAKGNYSNVQPVGIIDLECYTTVERSSMDDLVLELTGDAIKNPDLRSFSFQGESTEDCEHWTKAFLSDRHSALKDEIDAYKEITEGFPSQLTQFSEMLDEAEEKQKIAERKAYNVRSAAEESRKKVISMVREALELRHGEDGINEYYSEGDDPNLNDRRLEFTTKLDKITTGAAAVSMNAGVCESVEILAHYAEILRLERAEFGKELRDMNERVKDLGHSMISRKEMEEMQSRLEHAMKTNQADRARMSERITSLEKLLKKERQERADAERTLEAKNMEFTMLSAASKQKIQELFGHKKILKKEVIELRKKIEDISSDATVYKHKTDGLDLQVKAEQQKNKVLERHLEHVTEQIKMQERVMDCMMSQSGSVFGGDSRAGDNYSAGGNSSYRGGYHRSRSDNSKVGYGSNYNELPRSKSLSRNIPPEISSKSISRQKELSKSNKDARLGSSKTSNRSAKMYDNTSHGSTSDDSQDDSLEQTAEGTDYDDDDDIESRGNVSELTEDRTFRLDNNPTHNLTSPTKSKQSSFNSKPPRGFIQMKEYDTNEQSTNLQKQSLNTGVSPPVDVVRETKREIANSQSSSRLRPPASDHRDQTHRPPLSVEKNNSRNNRTPSRDKNYGNGHQRIIQNLPTGDAGFHLSNENGSVAMSSIHSGLSGASHGTGKLSVAQRARLEADLTSSSKVIRPPTQVVAALQIETAMSTVTAGSNADPTTPGNGSVWSKLGNKIVDTIDNSVFAVKIEDDDQNEQQDGSSQDETELKEEEKKSQVAERPVDKNLSLAERQRLQKEKQLAFLKRQGLLRSEQNHTASDRSVTSLGDRSRRN